MNCDQLRALLAGVATCGCSYDRPGDVCMYHSPALVKAESRAEAAERERDAAVTLLKRIDDAADGVVAFTIWIGLNHGDDIDGFEEQASLSVDPLQDLRRDITAFVAALAASGGTG